MKAMVFERPSGFLPAFNESNTVPCNYGIRNDTLLGEERRGGRGGNVQASAVPHPPHSRRPDALPDCLFLHFRVPQVVAIAYNGWMWRPSR